MNELEYAQKRMQQKWYDLAMAEQRGVALPILERMYNAYVLAMEEYNRRYEEYQRAMQIESDHSTVKQRKAVASKGKATPQDGGHSRMAS